jgi:hypothetical protein
MTRLTVRIAAVVAIWLGATVMLTVAYNSHHKAFSETLPQSVKGDRQEVRVIPLQREPELTAEALARSVRPPQAPPAPPQVETAPPVQVTTKEQAEDPKPKPNVCERTGGRKVVTRGGRSWRCEYKNRRVRRS